MFNFTSQETLKRVSQEFVSIAEDLSTYCISRSRTDWAKYKKMVKSAKWIFFDNSIQEIALSNKRLCNLMNWVRKQKLPATEAIKFNGHLYNKLDNL